MIANTDGATDCERILALLSRYQHIPCVRPVFSDILEIQRLLTYYSFRAPQLADRFADQLSARYRYEIYALYGPSLLKRRRSDSSYLCLQHLLGSLIRVAVMRLCCEGVLSLSRTQIASGDGLLLLALTNETGRG